MPPRARCLWLLALLAGCSPPPAAERPASAPASLPSCTGPSGQPRPCRAPLVAHGSTTCVGLPGGSARCWGEGLSPPLPRGRAGRARGDLPDDLADVDEVAVGASAVCVRRGDADVGCWRRAVDGAPRPAMVRVVFPYGTGRIAQIAIDPQRPSACALSADRVLCFDLGDGGDAFARPPAEAVPAAGTAQLFFDAQGKLCARREKGGVACTWGEVPDLEGTIDVATEGPHFCALRRGGEVLCGLVEPGVVAPIERWQIPSARRIVMGMGHRCALAEGGEVLCWGQGARGQLGPGRLGERLAPAPVAGLPPAVALAAGHAHTCAEDASGSVRCWGLNDQGQIGRPRGSSPPALPVPGVDGAVGLASSDHASCALLPGGNALCWGALDGGPGAPPSAWPSAQGLASLSMGDSSLGCGLSASGVRCLGPHDSEAAAKSGGPIEGSSAASAVVLVDGRSKAPLACMLASGGPPRCWGQVGSVVREAPSRSSGGGATRAAEQAPTRWRSPRPVPELSGAIAAADGAACFLMESGEVFSWLEECSGKRCQRTARRVEGLGGARAVAGEGATCCALSRGGSVACKQADHTHETWGDPFTTDVSFHPKLVPTEVTTLAWASNARSIAARQGKLCAALDDGSVRCGPVGDGSPEPVEGVSGAVEVSLGSAHGCARLEGGKVACWGYDGGGQLGPAPGVAVDRDAWPTPLLVGISESGR